MMSRSSPLVTVIIPTYNRADTIGRAIRSVLQQTHQAFELLIVDDGSTDSTVERIQQFADPRIVHLRNEMNLGQNASLNRGLSVANGEYMSFLDSDDEWLPSKLYNQLNALRIETGYKICHTNEIWIRNSRRVNPMKKHEKSGGLIFNNCLPLCVISPSSVIIHHSVFEQYGLFDESLPVCEDYDLWLRLCAFLPVLYLDKPQIVKYGGHKDQLSHKYWGMDRFRIAALEKIVANQKLSAENKSAALLTLLEKIDIYILGASKRKKNEDTELYSKKRSKYQELVDNGN